MMCITTVCVGWKVEHEQATWRCSGTDHPAETSSVTVAGHHEAFALCWPDGDKSTNHPPIGERQTQAVHGGMACPWDFELGL